MQNSTLLEKIERCRAEMIMLSNSYEMTDDIVIKSSKELDELLNQYQFESQSNRVFSVK